MTVEFQSNIDFNAYQQDFKHDLRTRIDNVFAPEQASQMTRYLEQDIPYHNAYTSNGEPRTIAIDELRKMGPEQQQLFIHRIYSEASKGVGFLYGRHKFDTVHGDSLSSRVLKWLNSDSTLQRMRELTGHNDIQSASAQATRYTPGHFLTRHNDIHDKEQRRVAYVLNFTETWHPDWGGLLQFYQQDGTPRDAWAPKFNSMVLFDVNHVHAVTYVAPYAAKPRLAITGWFRATPL